MVVISTLRGAAASTKLLQLPLFRNAGLPMTKCNGNIALQIRNMGGHKKTINIVPGKYETKHWLDRVHLYTMLAVIPAAAIIAYANLFVGQAKLVDIPEDYEPKHWEYHKHPIARFWAKYVVENPVRVYEINLHHLWDVREKRRLRLLESKVKSLMNQRQDVKTWYYVPVNSEQMVYAGYHARKEEEKTFGR